MKQKLFRENLLFINQKLLGVGIFGKESSCSRPGTLARKGDGDWWE
jgi:hypothetical protein